MELWILIAVFAYLLSAVVVLIDKYLVTSPEIPDPVVYAFYVGILSAFPIVIVPFGFVSIPNTETLLLSAFVAVTFISSVVLLYRSLKTAAATDVMPLLGASAAASTLFFSNALLGTDLSFKVYAGIALLIFGMLHVAHFRFTPLSLFYVILSGVLMSLSTVLIKIMFVSFGFADAFFWSRMANVAGALILLLWPPNALLIARSFRRSSPKTRFLVVFNKALAGLVFLLILISIRLGDVSVVNALAGLQFVFLLLFVVLLARRKPEFFKETLRPGHVAHKLFAMTFIVAGFLVIFL